MTTVSDDAVGVPDTELPHWFIAIVNHNKERIVAQRLDALRIPSFVASQKELRIRQNGRKVTIDRIVIPAKVFVHCTEKERREIVNLPFINRFMTNRAGESGGLLHKPLATVPEDQIMTLRFMLGCSDNPVSITDRPFLKGEKVKVIRGSLKGLEGEIIKNPEGSDTLYVYLDILGFAKVEIDPLDVMHV